jgi:GGDEF domain-containing protein/GNAT superfamily N-acetyltransferase
MFRLWPLKKYTPEEDRLLEWLKGKAATDPEAAEYLGIAERSIKSAWTDSMLQSFGNRRAYDDFLSRHADKGGAHVVIDLNDFGMINKDHSHEIGDLALQDFERITQPLIQHYKGKSFRRGGDEFSVWFESPDAAHMFVRELSSQLDQANKKRQFGIEGNGRPAYNLSASIGIGWSPEHAEDALARAKRSLGMKVFEKHPVTGVVIPTTKRVNHHPPGQAPTVYWSGFANTGYLSPYEPKQRKEGMAQEAMAKSEDLAKASIAGATQIGHRLGSNPGGVFEQDGKRFYFKFQPTPDHAKNEVLAAKLYEAAGHRAVPIEHLEDHHGTASPWLQGVEDADFRNEDHRRAVQAGFAVHAWLANWDAVVNHNTSLYQGQPITMDTGGALLYRAQGSPKGRAFGPQVSEFHTLRDPGINRVSAWAFGDMSPEQIVESVSRVARVPDATIDQLVQQYGPGDAGTKTWLAQTLKARRENLVQMAEAETGMKVPREVQPAPAAPKAPAKPLQKRVLDPSEGYRITHRTQTYTNWYETDPAKRQFKVTSVEAYDPNGQLVGRANLDHRGDRLIPGFVYVEEEHRRKGIASAMYAHAEEATGLKIHPSHIQTEEGRALWAGNAKQPQFGLAKAEGDDNVRGLPQAPPDFPEDLKNDIALLREMNQWSRHMRTKGAKVRFRPRDNSAYGYGDPVGIIIQPAKNPHALVGMDGKVLVEHPYVEREGQDPHVVQRWYQAIDLEPYQEEAKVVPFRKGERGDWQRDGYTIEHEVSSDGKSISVVAKLGDQVVGNLDADHSEAYPGTLHPTMVRVAEAHRRKGLATAMYVRAEQILGAKFHRGAYQSPEAKALWNQKNRPFGQE